MAQLSMLRNKRMPASVMVLADLSSPVSSILDGGYRDGI